MKTHLSFQKAAAVASLIIAFHFSVLAAPGDLDTSFNNVGYARTGFGQGSGFGYAAVVQSDGKLVIAGGGSSLFIGTRFALARFNTNNLMDISFGVNGRVLTPVGLETNASAYAVAAQPDGKLVVAGYGFDTTNRTSPKLALVRYLTNGMLDASFGIGGKVYQYPPGANSSYIDALALQSDGKIVVGGGFSLLNTNNTGTNGCILVRFQTNGAVDTSFGNGGSATVVVPGGSGAVFGLLALTNGDLVAVGSDYATSGIENFVTMRFTTNGVLDSSFGSNGIVLTYVSYPPFLYSVTAIAHQVVLQPGNPQKLVVAGEANLNNNAEGFAVVRYNMNGSLDTTFGNGGIVTNIFPPVSAPTTSYGEGVVVQTGPPTTITVGGYNYSGGENYYFCLARLTTNGTYDTTFGTNGFVTLAFTNGSIGLFEAEAFAETTQAGKVLLAGLMTNPSEQFIDDLSAVRFNANGTVDTIYGTQGSAAPGGSDLPAQARALALQPDGKVLVAGGATSILPAVLGLNPYIAYTNNFSMVRYNADGSQDASFGSNGQVFITLTSGTNAQGNAVQIQPDGKAVVAGGAPPSIGSNLCFTLVRCATNGSLDGSFGHGGEVVTQIGSSNSSAEALLLQPDNKILSAGYAMSGTNTIFALARYLTNGALDSTFGGSGMVTPGLSSGNDEVFALVLQPDGKIVAAGFGQDGLNSDFALIRLETNGAVDTSFGVFGRVTSEFVAGNSSVIYGLVQQSDGRLVAAGSTALGNSTYVALARYNTNGTLDTYFGLNGLVITQIGPISDYATSLALQADGKILVAAVSEQVGGNYAPILRYNSDGTLDDTYGTGGIAAVSFNQSVTFNTNDNDYPCAVLIDTSGRAVFAATVGQLFGVVRLQTDAVTPVALSISYTETNGIRVFWPATPSGWNLQQSTNLLSGVWTTPPETTNTTGTSNYIVVTQAVSRTFFRLVYP